MLGTVTVLPRSPAAAYIVVALRSECIATTGLKIDAAWPTLQLIAIHVFSVGTSSSTSERNFSTWSHIWSNRANSIDFQRAVKLVYVYTNFRTLQRLKANKARKDHVDVTWLDDEIE